MKNLLKYIFPTIIATLLVSSCVYGATVLFPYQGGTGLGSYTTGDIIITTSTDTLYALPIGSTGQVLKITAGKPAWGTDNTGAGAAGLWSTSTAFTYLTDTSHDVVIGDNATATAEFWMDVATGDLTITGNLNSADSFLTSESDPIWLAASSSYYLIASDSYIKLVGDTTGVMTEDLNLDDGTLVISYDDNYVGIGTITPNAPLEVKGAKPGGNVGGFQSGMFHITGAGTAEFSNSVITGHNAYDSGFGSNTQLWYLGNMSSGNNDIGLLNRQNAAMHFYTNNSFRMAIDAAGNVGIGTTSPSQLLTVGAGNQFTVDASGNVVIAGTLGVSGALTIDTGLTGILRADSGVVSTTTAGSGTVTSVDMSVPTGLTIAGNPITTSGTLALDLDTGYVIVLDASTTNWETAYSWGDWGGNIDISTDTNLTAGRSLTLTDDDVLADAELYTDRKCAYIEDPTAADDLQSLWRFYTTSTITEIWCDSDQTIDFDLQEDDGSPADIMGTDLQCATTENSTTTFSDAAMANDSELDLIVTSVSGTPTWVSICWKFTVDD